MQSQAARSIGTSPTLELWESDAGVSMAELKGERGKGVKVRPSYWRMEMPSIGESHRPIHKDQQIKM